MGQIIPRLLRLRDAPAYLGMDRHLFNEQVRPHLKEYRIGKQGIGVDRLDVDDWFEHYKQRGERPKKIRGIIWDDEKRQGSLKGARIGILTNESVESAFKKALERTRSRKPNGM